MTAIMDALELAMRLQNAGRLHKAAKIYHQILKKHPAHADALVGMGEISCRRGHREQAEKFLRAAVAARPNSIEAWLALGKLRQAEERLPEALDYYRKALAIQPNSAPAHNSLGVVLERQGKIKDAAACYERALNLDPHHSESAVNLGNLLHSQGRLLADRLEHYATANFDLGVALANRADFDASIGRLRQAVAMNPRLTLAHYHLGVALQQSGDWQAAASCFREVLERDASHADTHRHLGQIEQARGRLVEAAAAFQRWLALTNPRYTGATMTTRDRSHFAVEHRAPPHVPAGEISVGGYAFPAIPPVTASEGPRPFWSVVIPLHNRTDFVLECLSSVLAQWSEEDMEILIMDNASAPPLLDLVNSLGHGLVRYFYNTENIGARRNFNLGIALSRGRWIHLLPEDEYVLPGFYSRLKESLQRCPDSIGAAFTGYENINEKGEVIFIQEHDGLHRGVNEAWLGRIGVANCLNPCAVVVRREIHERLGGYDPTNHFAPDWELYKRIASFYDWWCEPEVLARYRQHAGNMSSEVWLAGVQGQFYRQAIETSEGYLPAEHRAELTARARRHYSKFCLIQAAVPLRAGNLVGAFRLIQEALRIDRSPPAIAELFSWLAQDQAAPLRSKIVDMLIDAPAEDTEPGSFRFAYP